MIDFQSSREGEACIGCLMDLPKKDIIEKLKPGRVDSLEDICFIPEDDKPSGGSTVYSAAVGSHLMVMCWNTWLMGYTDRKHYNRAIF